MTCPTLTEMSVTRGGAGKRYRSQPLQGRQALPQPGFCEKKKLEDKREEGRDGKRLRVDYIGQSRVA